jgi:integrase
VNPKVWKPALVTAGVEPSRENGMHALRHHYASLLIHDGVSPRTLAEYLGHDDPGFTLRVYAHLWPESSTVARGAVDRAFAGLAAISEGIPGEGESP